MNQIDTNCPIYLRQILILSLHLRLALASSLFFQILRLKIINICNTAPDIQIKLSKRGELLSYYTSISERIGLQVSCIGNLKKNLQRELGQRSLYSDWYTCWTSKGSCFDSEQRYGIYLLRKTSRLSLRPTQLHVQKVAETEIKRL